MKSVMTEPTLQSVEAVWQRNRAALDDALTEAIGELEGLLKLDEHHRHGHDPAELERSLGPLAATSLDLGSLSKVLGESPRVMAPERLARIEALIPTLGELKEAWSNTAFDRASIDLDRDENEVLEHAEAYLNRLAAVFRALRITQLEIRSKYDSQTHDAAFADFDWRSLGPGELQSSPPFVLIARLDGDAGTRLRKVMSLLETGMPIKVVALRSSLREPFRGSTALLVPPGLTLETLPLGMRGVYFVQTCAAVTDFEQRLFAGLAAPRPAVMSILCEQDGETQESFRSRAERAIRARMFPLCVYDPDRDPRFVMCFDLSGNPSVESQWTTDTLHGLDPDGNPVEMAEAFTVAHFAATEPEFAVDLTAPPASPDALVQLTDYLALSHRQRIGKRPFIRVAGEDGHFVRKVVSTELTGQCAERLHLWRTLQEISGVDNPHVKRTRAALQKELGSQQEAQLQSLRKDMEQDAAHRERAAVATTVRKLVARLTGVDPPSN
jgi:hypothetical protein